jgi:hypothetical protein
MASLSQGPLSPQTVTEIDTYGNRAWTNINNILLEDGQYATCSSTNVATSYYAKVTNFGFTIPTNATIDGIQVDIKRRREDVDGTPTVFAKDSSLIIVKDDVIKTTDLKSSEDYPLVGTYKSYGGGTEKWGETWTPSDINSSTFGVALSVIKTGKNGLGAMSTPAVDNIRMTVYYTEGGSSGTLKSIGGFATASISKFGSFTLSQIRSIGGETL